jgi:hypothetical protein
MVSALRAGIDKTRDAVINIIGGPAADSRPWVWMSIAGHDELAASIDRIRRFSGDVGLDRDNAAGGDRHIAAIEMATDRGRARL